MLFQNWLCPVRPRGFGARIATFCFTAALYVPVCGCTRAQKPSLAEEIQGSNLQKMLHYQWDVEVSALLYQYSGQPDEAFALAKRFSRQFPHSVEPKILLLTLRWRLDRHPTNHELAGLYLDSPHDLALRVLLAKSAAALGRMDAVREHLQTLVRLTGPSRLLAELKRELGER